MHLIAILILIIGILFISIPIFIPYTFLDKFNSKYGMVCALLSFILCVVTMSLLLHGELLDYISAKKEMPDNLYYTYVIGIPLLIIFTIFATIHKLSKSVYAVEPKNHITKFWSYLFLIGMQIIVSWQTYEYYHWANDAEYKGSFHSSDRLFIYIYLPIVIGTTIFAFWVNLKGKISSAPKNFISLIFKYGRVKYWYVLEHFEGQCIICFKKYFFVGGRMFDKKNIKSVEYIFLKLLTIELKEEKIQIKLDKSNNAAFQNEETLITYFKDMADANNRQNKQKKIKIKATKSNLISFSDEDNSTNQNSIDIFNNHAVTSQNKPKPNQIDFFPLYLKSKYEEQIVAFYNMKRKRKNGIQNPQYPVFILSIIYLFEKCEYSNSMIFLNKQFKHIYHEIWNNNVIHKKLYNDNPSIPFRKIDSAFGITKYTINPSHIVLNESFLLLLQKSSTRELIKNYLLSIINDNE